MLSSVSFATGMFRDLESYAGVLGQPCWNHFPAQVMVVGISADNNYLIEAAHSTQGAQLNADAIRVGQRLGHLLSPSFGAELVSHCQRCVEARMPIQYEIMGSSCVEEAGHGYFQVLLFPIMKEPGIVDRLLCVILSISKEREVQVAKYSEQELERRVVERTADLIATNLQLSYQASHDSLTNTFNRRHLMEAANAEFMRATRYGLNLCLMMVDIDHFKSINDEQGHLMGDVMLKTVAHTIRAAVRDWDLVGRYGGDEFIILLPETDMPGAHAIAERLSHMLKGARLPVSIGIATLEAHDQSISDLICRADHFLLNAKRNGRNRVECAAFNTVPGC